MNDFTDQGLFDKLSRLKDEAAVTVTPQDDPGLVAEPVSDDAGFRSAIDGDGVETASMTLSEPPEKDDCKVCKDDDDDDAPGAAPDPNRPDDPDIITGTDGDDDITATHTSKVDGVAGNNFVQGSAGDDTISGGPGDDLLLGGDGDDILVGGDGSDVLRGGAGDDTLIGGGGTAEDMVVNITFTDTCGGNTLGFYLIDPCGEIQFLRFAEENAFGGPSGEKNTAETTLDFKLPPFAQLGSFVLVDGVDLNGGYDGLGEGTFAFLTAEGDPATVSDSAPQLVHIAPDGTQTALQGDIWHSAGFGDAAGLNSSGGVQVKGLSENPDGSFSFGFEAGACDVSSVFDDLLLTVDMGTSGARFVNPDFDVKGTLPSETSGQNFLSGGEGDDWIVTGDFGDTVYGGSGNDTIFAGPGDVVDGGTGNDTLIVKDPSIFKKVVITSSFINEDGKESFNGFIKYKDTDEVTEFVCIEKIIPCFTPGTSIATPRGERLVEELREGDKIITRDNGIQEIRWIGQRPLDWVGLAANPHLKPVLIQKGALGNGLPERDIMVSPQHRFLVVNERTQLYFDEHEVLVAAKHLVDHRGVRSVESSGLTYVHFMCDRHEVVLANGAWSETFQPGDYTLGGMGNAQRLELFELFPELATKEGREDYASARKTLKRHEARLIAS